MCVCVCVCYHGRGSEQPAGTPTCSLKPLYSTTLPCIGIHREEEEVVFSFAHSLQTSVRNFCALTTLYWKVLRS